MKNLLLKKISKHTLGLNVKKMLSHFESNNFVNLNPHNNALRFGFNGELLKQNIKREWVLSNQNLCEEPSFIVKSVEVTHIEEIFAAVKCLVNSFPIGFVQCQDWKQPNHLMELEEKSNPLIARYFSPSESSVLRKLTVCEPSTSLQFFHKHQRERKMWWRKFFSLPGRFCMTEIKEDSRGQYVEIQAEFPWGLETLETVSLDPKLLLNSSIFEIRRGTKKFHLQAVTSEVKLETMCMAYLCDAYDPINEETDRESMRLHRKLAPYKISLACSSTETENRSELYELGLVLIRDIKKVGISTLLLPDCTKKSLQAQFLRNDAFGTPYTIVLNDKTLKDGILGLRNRDTTLEEQCHVSKIVSYVELLMKNY